MREAPTQTVVQPGWSVASTTEPNSEASTATKQRIVDITQISQTLRDDAVVLVFTNVLMQQLGLPVPAVPTLLLAGSLAVSSSSLGQVLAAAIVASVIADWLWYWVSVVTRFDAPMIT